MHRKDKDMKTNTSMYNLRKAELNKNGFRDVRDWMNKTDHVYIGRYMRIFIHTDLDAYEPMGSKVVLVNGEKKIEKKDAPLDIYFIDGISIIQFGPGSYVNNKGKIVELYQLPQSIWHNPFKGEGAAEKYRNYLYMNGSLLSRLKELRGKKLGCWCHPNPCHGHIILEALKNLEDNTL